MLSRLFKKNDGISIDTKRHNTNHLIDLLRRDASERIEILMGALSKANHWKDGATKTSYNELCALLGAMTHEGYLLQPGFNRPKHEIAVVDKSKAILDLKKYSDVIDSMLDKMLDDYFPIQHFQTIVCNSLAALSLDLSSISKLCNRLENMNVQGNTNKHLTDIESVESKSTCTI